MRDNHNPMMVEQRVNRFLNLCLQIFCAERGTTKLSESGLLVSDTNISRIVTGREFHFPINYSADTMHQMLTSLSARVVSFAGGQAQLLKASRAVAHELVHQHRAYHCELMKRAVAPYPSSIRKVTSHFTFIRRTVKFDKAKGRVGKVVTPYRGPWEVVEKLAGSSYAL